METIVKSMNGISGSSDVRGEQMQFFGAPSEGLFLVPACYGAVLELVESDTQVAVMESIVKGVAISGVLDQTDEAVVDLSENDFYSMKSSLSQAPKANDFLKKLLG